ncbi:uncharacterized protein IWZ02DRAFT_270252 [Phyllosticta citriasiana]|uniref:RanBP2-type domain-containing protein n=1 Tax=Phyllosticta citriasiana TaxID=595635 RepID=A0ABR1KZL6_9PEZI
MGSVFGVGSPKSILTYSGQLVANGVSSNLIGTRCALLPSLRMNDICFWYERTCCAMNSLFGIFCEDCGPRPWGRNGQIRGADTHSICSLYNQTRVSGEREEGQQTSSDSSSKEVEVARDATVRDVTYLALHLSGGGAVFLESNFVCRCSSTHPSLTARYNLATAQYGYAGIPDRLPSGPARHTCEVKESSTASRAATTAKEPR